MPSLLDKSFVYHGADTHSDPQAFRERMQARKVAAQNHAQWQRTGHATGYKHVEVGYHFGPHGGPYIK